MWSSRLTALEALHSRHLHFYTKYDAPSIKENGNMSLGIRNKISTLLSCVAWATMTISVKCCVSNLNLPIQLACRTWLAIDFLDWKLKLNQQQLFILDFFFFFHYDGLHSVEFSPLYWSQRRCTGCTRTYTLSYNQRHKADSIWAYAYSQILW